MNDENATPLVDDVPDATPDRESEPAQKEFSTKDQADFQAFLQWRQAQGKGNVPQDEDPDVYVHLANGEVRRVKTSEVPQSGTGAYGHFEEDNKVHQIIGIHPVEVER